MSKLSLALPGIIKLYPTRESFVSDIPAGDGKIANLFCSVAGASTSTGASQEPTGYILFCAGLVEDSEYECLVQARNRFGWSEPSRLFTFFTSKKGEQTNFSVT